jgi:septal ring factor EnvC (AmiA/AmiB activator)
MPLTDDDLKAIGSLMDLKLQPVLDRMDRRDSEVNARFDALIKQNEDREREYLLMSAQLGRQDKQFASMAEHLGRHDKQLAAVTEQLDRIETKVGRYDQYLDDLDARFTVLEEKTA